jgi:hypothetical protein
LCPLVEMLDWVVADGWAVMPEETITPSHRCRARLYALAGGANVSVRSPELCSL